MISLARSAFPSSSVAGAAARSLDLLRRWIDGEEEALIQWLEGDRDRFGVVRLLAQRDRTIARQVRALHRQILQIKTLRDALLAASRVPQAARSSRDWPRRLRSHPREFMTRRGGARLEIPRAREVRTLFGAILALAVAYAVRAAWDIVAFSVLPL